MMTIMAPIIPLEANRRSKPSAPGHAPCRRRIANARGFTLIETLIAMTVLTIGVLGVASMMTVGALNDRRAHDLAQAAEIFGNVAESAYPLQFDPILFRGMTAPDPLLVTRDGTAYTMVCTLADDAPLAPCKELTCLVTWNAGIRRHVSQHTYVFAAKY